MDNTQKIEKLEKIQNNFLINFKKSLFGLNYNGIDLYFFMGFAVLYVEYDINIFIFTLIGVLYMVLSEKIFNKK